MNYIILNGEHSELINGLLIQTLPDIIKPPMRTQIDEIDGKDGDIVTFLGYSAYDKDFQIGLHGDYDIDEVISYFNSYGTVTFSNEDDKLYKYIIKDQIDFEKLIRFKTATVTMHVQPFKFSVFDKQKSFIFEPEAPQYFEIRNDGNVYSKPKLIIHGSGTINLNLNGNQMFVIELGDEENITIDVEETEAYKDGILKNRLVNGDYDNFVLDIGKNEISFSGDVNRIDIENYSRWI